MKRETPSPSLSLVPEHADFAELVHAARRCHACGLYKNATQTVFGEGPVPAPIVLVGEQPGDKEDIDGHPFVGPAGRVLDVALEEAGIPRDQVYVTNAVKHFKWEPRGKRRLHSRPNTVEIHACHGWLEAEIALAKPDVIVCLGVTAAQAVLGRGTTIGKSRGRVLEGSPLAPHAVVTYHPSALLRVASDPAAYAAMKSELDADLARAAGLVTFRRTRGEIARGLQRRPSGAAR